MQVDAAGSVSGALQGLRGVARVARRAGVMREMQGYRRTRGDALETIGSLTSIVRPLRRILIVAVDPIFESAMSRCRCDGSSTGVPLNDTTMSPGRTPAS